MIKKLFVCFSKCSLGVIFHIFGQFLWDLWKRTVYYWYNHGMWPIILVYFFQRRESARNQYVHTHEQNWHEIKEGVHYALLYFMSLLYPIQQSLGFRPGAMTFLLNYNCRHNIIFLYESRNQIRVCGTYSRFLSDHVTTTEDLTVYISEAHSFSELVRYQF